MSTISDISDSDFGLTPASPIEQFLEFARRDVFDEVKARLQINPKLLNQTGELGFTALHYAALCGSSTIVDYLIQSGASLDLQNSNGDTALHLAAWKNHVMTAEILITSKASFSIKNREGKLPRDLALSQEMKDVFARLENAEARKSIQMAPESDDDDDEEW